MRSPAGSLRASDIGTTVTVSGWVQRRRDHGGIAFIDVRDASGVIQVVADPAELCFLPGQWEHVKAWEMLRPPWRELGLGCRWQPWPDTKW